MKETISDVAGDVHSYLVRIDSKPCSVTLKKGVLTIHYLSSEDALNASMRLLSSGNFVQPMDVASYVLSLCCICGYVLRNACEMRRVNGQAPFAGFDTPFDKHVTENSRSSDFRTALITSSHHVTVLFRCPEQKKFPSYCGNQKPIPFDGSFCEVIPMHRFRIKSKKLKRKFTCTPEHKHLKFLKFSAKKANLLSD